MSNHVIGSHALAMSLIADFERDGLPDIAIPTLDRRAVRLITFAPGNVRNLAVLQVPTRAIANFGPTDINSRQAVLLGLEDGRLVVIHE